MAIPTLPPKWFVLSHYDAARNLNPTQWLYQVSIRLFLEGFWHPDELQNRPQLPYQSDHEILLLRADDYWQAIEREGIVTVPQKGDDAYPDPYAEYRYLNSEFAYSTMRTLTTLETLSALEHWAGLTPTDGFLDDGSPITSRSSLESVLHERFPGDDISTCFVGIDLSVDDARLIKRFKAWLETERTMFRKAGTAKAGLGTRTYQLWHQYRVLAYWDLKIWAEVNETRYTNRELADFLFPDNAAYDGETVRQKVGFHMKKIRNAYTSLRSMA